MHRLGMAFMRATNYNACPLADCGSDTLRQIIEWLPFESISLLYRTGHSKLCVQFLQPNVIKTCGFSTNKLERFCAFVRCLSSLDKTFLQHVNTLFLEGFNVNYGLGTLLESNLVNSSRLTSLALSFNFAITPTVILRLPRSLTKLALKGTDAYITGVTLEELPPYLTDLSLERRKNLWYNPSEDDLKSDSIGFLPKNLRHLRLDYGTLCDRFAKFLPRTLVSLRLGARVGGNLNGRFIVGLPVALTSLKVFRADNIDAIYLRDLPVGLLNLKLGMLPPYITPSVLDLPRGLLRLGMDANLNDADIPDLPRHLIVLKLRVATYLTDSCLLDMPRNLTHLSIPGNLLSKHCADTLPKSITSLDLPYHEICCSYTRHENVQKTIISELGCHNDIVRDAEPAFFLDGETIVYILAAVVAISAVIGFIVMNVVNMQRKYDALLNQ